MHKRDLCCRPVSVYLFIRLSRGGSYCQTSVQPDCPIICIFDLQRRYPIPREPLLRGRGPKILEQWENSVIFD